MPASEGSEMFETGPPFSQHEYGRRTSSTNATKLVPTTVPRARASKLTAKTKKKKGGIRSELRVYSRCLTPRGTQADWEPCDTFGFAPAGDPEVICS